jgi:hypothetical protein
MRYIQYTSATIRGQVVAQFKSAVDFRNFKQAVRRNLRYVRGTAHEDFLQAVLETSATRRLSPTNKTYFEGLWRAQLGHGLREVEKDGDVYAVPCAHPKSRMKPIPEKVSDGRANPKGITCLYLATDEKTAILEVRPLIGLYVTIAKMEITRPLEIVDCTSAHINMMYRFGVQSIEEVERAVWSDINNAFSEPVERGDDSLDYIPTQILAKLFKCNGPDGIMYKR